ncbi:hypothetical protein AB0I28_10200 [Phytomonospora sp. NPDC050363]
MHDAPRMGVLQPVEDLADHVDGLGRRDPPALAVEQGRRDRRRGSTPS